MENGKLFRTTLNHYIPLDVIIKLEHFTLTHLNHYIPLDVIIKLVHFILPQRFCIFIITERATLFK